MIPAEALTQHVAIVGTVGAGKTFTAKGVVESLLDAGKRVCVIDPTSAWWGLRLLADGKSPGFKIAILGGEHGDIPLGEAMGGKVGEMIGTRNMPAVLDLSEMLIGERHRFMTEFAESLFKHNRTPLHLVIDEADEFCPQNPLPESRRMLHHVDRIVRRGRIRGFRVTMITQRPATLHKNVLTQANTLIAMRLTSPQDRKAIEEWVKGNADGNEAKEVLGSLASLKRGTGWLWCPSLSILKKTAFPAIKTFDSSRSPEEGDEAPAPVALAPVDIAELRASLSGPSDEKAKMDKGLESQPSRMVEKINSAGAEDRETVRRLIINTDPEIQDRIRDGARAAYEQGFAAGRFAAVQALGQFARQLADAIGDAKEATERAHRLMDSYAGFVESMDAETTKTAKNIPENIPARIHGYRESLTEKEFQQVMAHPNGKYAEPVQKPNGSGGGAELRILRVLAARHPAKFTRAQWATLSGMKKSGGTWSTYVSRLRTAGYINEEGGVVGLTKAGLAAAGTVQRPSNGSVIQQWKDALGTGPSKMIDVLIHAHPHGMDRANLADRVGMTATGGTFQTYLSRLRSNGLIEDKGRRIMASGILFADGAN